jgi:hypothetical protein
MFAGPSVAFELSGARVGEWHCAEILRDVTNGHLQFWIDGTSVQNLTGLALTTNTQSFQCGDTGNWLTTEAHALYIDDVVLSDSYIGPIPTYLATRARFH